MSDVIELPVGRPSPEQISLYAESHAYKLLLSRGIPTKERTVTAAFLPSARNNLGAVRHWIYELVSSMDHLRAHTLDADMILAKKLEWAFDDRLNEIFAVGLHDW